MEHFTAFDTKIFLFLNRDIANPVFDLLFPLITDGRFWIIPGIAVATWYARKERFNALWVMGVAIAAVALTDPVCAKVFKPFFGRMRPCHPDAFVEGGRFLIGMKRSYAFPSNHAANMGSLVFVLCRYHRKYWYWFVFFALMIGYSRIYTGVHFPADVLAGFALGAVCAFFTTVVAERARRTYFKWQSGKSE